jgi:SAM-dependent methyltransferase
VAAIGIVCALREPELPRARRTARSDKLGREKHLGHVLAADVSEPKLGQRWDCEHSTAVGRQVYPVRVEEIPHAMAAQLALSRHGPNFPYYSDGVTRLLAVEPEPYFREHARRAAPNAAVPIEVSNGTAEELPGHDGEFDAVVVSLVLCSVDDQAAALAEVMRVLRPGGQLRFYEHVISNQPRLARIQRLGDATIYPHFSGGCHAARDTGAAIGQAGFEILHQDRIAFKPAALVPAIPHILGVAVRPV